MTAELHEVPKKRVSLPTVEEFSTILRTMFINIGFFGATILLIPAVGAQLTRNAVVIEPIAVPPALVEQGLTPEVVANRVWDGLQEFAQSASDAREAVVAIPDSQLVEFSLPDAGISVDSIFTQIRQFFGAYDTRLVGEVLCATSACERQGLRLRLRVIRNDSAIVDLPEMGALSERDYYREAAAGIYEIIDPYVAIAAQAETAPVRAAALARRLIAEGTRDAKWAHNLVGDIERRAGDAERAATDYRAALALDEHFEAARAGLAQALADAGDIEGAQAVVADLEKRDARNRLGLPILAEMAAKQENIDEAIRLLRLATERDPLNPLHLTRAGNIALEAGRQDEALSLFGDALQIDPAYGPALTKKAYVELASNDLDAAEATYRQWLDYEPENVDALLSLGNLQLGMRRFAAAVDTYNQVLAIRPDSPDTHMLRGGALLGLSRFSDAVAALETATAGLPDSELAFRLLGRAYRGDGRTADAIAAFEQAIVLDPNGPFAAQSQQAIEELRAAPAAAPSP
jgi:tetratricopeptide (TPR) repeat protein